MIFLLRGAGCPASAAGTADGLGAAEMTRAVIESVAENTCDAVVARCCGGPWPGCPGWPSTARSTPWTPWWATARPGICASAGPRPAWTTPRTGFRPGSPRRSPSRARSRSLCRGRPPRARRQRDILCQADRPGPPGKPSSGTARAIPARTPGRCEAAFAGALGVRLGGTNSYGGAAEMRPGLGDGRAPEPGDIRRAVRLSRAVTVATAGLAVLVALTRGGRRSR